MTNIIDNKKEKDKKEKEKNTGLKVYTIQGTELGDVKTVKIYPNGHIQIHEGGF